MLTTTWNRAFFLGSLLCLPISFAQAEGTVTETNASPTSPVLNVVTLAPNTSISGRVAYRDIRFPATLLIKDQHGVERSVKTDIQGRFYVDVSSLVTPLRLSAIEAGGQNCLLSNQLRAVCLGALVPELRDGHENRININPLTDRILSEVAVSAGYIGPQQLIDAATLPSLSTTVWETAYREFHVGFDDALKQAGIADPSQFDPLTYSDTMTPAFTKILQVINHTRGYNNNNGQASHTVLTDIKFRPIAGLNASGSYEPLDLTSANQHRKALEQSHTRIFIVSDSTAATYEKARFPRMGWGQVFEQQFRPGGDVTVVNGAARDVVRVISTTKGGSARWSRLCGRAITCLSVWDTTIKTAIARKPFAARQMSPTSVLTQIAPTVDRNTRRANRICLSRFRWNATSVTHRRIE